MGAGDMGIASLVLTRDRQESLQTITSTKSMPDLGSQGRPLQVGVAKLRSVGRQFPVEGAAEDEG